jgi:(2Fe-2S) ferredoxin
MTTEPGDPFIAAAIGSRRAHRRPTALVCRGCCCGNPGKHPWTDHDAHLARLRAAGAIGGVKVRTVDCLAQCSSSNLVVVLPCAKPAVWLARINDDHALDLVCTWLADGAPRTPEALEPLSSRILERHHQHRPTS